MSADELLTNLLRFITLLRGTGIPIGPDEVLDSLRALQFVNLENRQEVKNALVATLIKSPRHLPVFTEAFSVYFVPPEKREEKEKARREKMEREEQARQQAMKVLRFQEHKLQLSPEDLELYGRLARAEREGLQEFLTRTSHGHNVGANFKPLVESLVRSYLAYWRHRLPEPRSPVPLPSTGDPELDALLGEVGEILADNCYRLLYADLESIGEHDMAEASQLIQLLARQLATRVSRKWQLSQRHKRLDLRRTIRRNIGHGGTLVQLQYRKRRVQKPELVFLGDISGSMRKYTAFVLQFILGLTRVIRSMEIFFFSEKLGRATTSVRPEDNISSVAEKVADMARQWGEGTRLDVALASLLQDYSFLLRRRTILLVISDTKTQNVGQAASLLQEVRWHVRDIIWLNTLPREEWKRYPGAELFSRSSHMFACRTMADLEQVLRSRLLAA